MGHLEATQDPPRQLLTRAEVVARLQVSPSTVARLLASGELPCVRIGRAVRVREDDFASFVERHRSTADGDRS
jgi:excisionase family DNA binding protein